MRDVLSGLTPKIFERGELYAIAAAFSAAMFLACDWLHFSREISTTIGALCGFSFATAGSAVSLADETGEAGGVRSFAIRRLVSPLTSVREN